MGSYSKVYPSIMKKVMQFLHTSPVNRLFGGGNLMVAVARAMGHYKETFKQKVYITFNVKDFSLLGRYTMKEQIEAEQHFNYKSRLEPSKSGKIKDDQMNISKNSEVDVHMRSGTPSPQQGSNEDEDDWSYLDEVVTKVKDSFRRIRRQA